jgi:hypothetical protein
VTSSSARFDALLVAQGVRPIAVGDTTRPGEELSPAQRVRIRAEMAVRAQRGILWEQREGLRHALDGLGNSREAPWWRRQIAETERRLAEAELVVKELPT